MNRKRYFLSTAGAIFCLVIVVATIVINGLGHSHAATTPTTTGKATPPSPSALSASHGRVLWHFTAGPNTSIGWNWSPGNGAVYFVSSDGIVHALAASDGAKLWQQPLGISGRIASVVNGVVYVITDRQYPTVDSAIYALSVTNGSLLWHYTLQGTRFGGVGPVFIIDHRLFVISDFNHGAFGLTLLAPATGSLIWPRPPITGEYLDTGNLEPFTIIHGVMYFNTYWVVYAVRISDGTTLWSYQPQDDVAKMIVYHNVVYLHHGIYESGRITAHKATDGALLWSYQPQNPSSMLSVVNGVIYVYSSNNVDAINASNGTLLWNYAATSVIGIINGVVYLYDWNTSTIFALNASTGTTLWSHVLSKSKVYRVQMVIKGIVYVQSNFNDIYAFDSSTGTLLWRYPTGS